jgi:hypothetical protein
MKFPSRTLAALLVAGSLPVFAGSAAAAPVGQPHGLKNADVSAVEQVQYRRWRSGRWIGPAIGGFAAGVAVGALAAPRYYDDGYYAYGAAPGYGVYAAPTYVEPGYRRWGNPNSSTDTPAPGSSALCPGTSDGQSAYPSWACR